MEELIYFQKIYIPLKLNGDKYFLDAMICLIALVS